MSLSSQGEVDRRAADHKTEWDGFFLECYSGAVPASASDLATGNKLAIFSLNGLGVTGITYEATPTDGVLTLDGSTYSATGLIAGDMTYARMVKTGDTGAASTTAVRRQLTIGTGATSDIIFSNVTVAVGVPKTLGALTYTASKQGG